MAKYTAEAVLKAWTENGKDFEKTQAALGISRASLYRLLTEVKKLEAQGIKVTVIPTPVVPVPAQVPAVAQAVAAPAAPIKTAVPAASVTAPRTEAQAAAAVPVPTVSKKTQNEAVKAFALAEGGGGAKLQSGEAGRPVDGLLDLSPYVPKKDGEILHYKPRKQYFEHMKTYYNTGGSILLVGEAGTGKTSLSRYLAYHLGLPFLEVSCDALLGFQELFGQVNITDGTSHFIEGLFLKFIQQPSIILLDEVNALDPAKNFKLHQLLNSGEIFVKEANRGAGKLYKVNPKCFIILAGNPPTGKYNGVNRFNCAFIDRPEANIRIEEFTAEELNNIIPAHEQKENLLRFYKEVREVVKRENLRTTFSIRSIKRILGGLSLGLDIQQSLLYGFLNGVELTAGQEAFNALYKLGQVIWDIK